MFQNGEPVEITPEEIEAMSKDEMLALVSFPAFLHSSFAASLN